MNEPKSVVRRVAIDKAKVLELLESEKRWTPITALDEVIKSSTLYQDALRRYELTGDYS